MKLTPTLKETAMTPTLKGLLILAAGVIWFFAIYIPQSTILSVMNTDLLTSLYLILEHGVLDTCIIISACYFATAVLARRVTPADLGLAQLPFVEGASASRWRTVGNVMLYLAASLVLVILGEYVLLIAQGQWETLLQNAFHLVIPINDWGMPDLLAHKPISFVVEVFVLCLLAPFAEEVFFRGFLFQWLARRMGLWLAVVVSALIFTVIHWSLFGFANTFLLGIFAALLLRSSRSLLPCIALHSFWNVLFVLFTIGVLH